MIRRSTLIIALAAALVAGGWAVTAAHADSVSSSGKSIVEQIGCDITNASDPKRITVDNPCQIKDFINLFIYLSKWGMSVLGVLAVFMFVYGGFQFVTAGGRASKVDEGKRVMTGTVIGTIIALTAYVIINTAVAAISGATIPSGNPFGPIAAVFGGQDVTTTIQGQTKPIKAPFSGQSGSGGSGGAGNDIRDCRKPTSAWERSCAGDQLQVYCADPGTSGGEITALQKKLNVKRCECGDTDGCFGPLTVACVRKFQIANLLPPSGVIDVTTKDKINNSGSRDCDASGSQADSVTSQLPQTQLSTAPGDGVGCCVVKSGQNDLYCVDGLTTRACQALGADSERVSGACGVAAGTVGRCGFCSNTSPPSRSDTKCFQLASPYWCTNIAENDLDAGRLSFNFGKCDSCPVCVKTILGIPIAP